MDNFVYTYGDRSFDDLHSVLSAISDDSLTLDEAVGVGYQLCKKHPVDYQKWITKGSGKDSFDNMFESLERFLFDELGEETFTHFDNCNSVDKIRNAIIKSVQVFVDDTIGQYYVVGETVEEFLTTKADMSEFFDEFN